MENDKKRQRALIKPPPQIPAEPAPKPSGWFSHPPVKTRHWFNGDVSDCGEHVRSAAWTATPERSQTSVVMCNACLRVRQESELRESGTTTPPTRTYDMSDLELRVFATIREERLERQRMKSALYAFAYGKAPLQPFITERVSAKNAQTIVIDSISSLTENDEEHTVLTLSEMIESAENELKNIQREYQRKQNRSGKKAREDQLRIKESAGKMVKRLKYLRALQYRKNNEPSYADMMSAILGRQWPDSRLDPFAGSYTARLKPEQER